MAASVYESAIGLVRSEVTLVHVVYGQDRMRSRIRSRALIGRHGLAIVTRRSGAPTTGVDSEAFVVGGRLVANAKV